MITGSSNLAASIERYRGSERIQLFTGRSGGMTNLSLYSSSLVRFAADTRVVTGNASLQRRTARRDQ
jgi:hypothetical protein